MELLQRLGELRESVNRLAQPAHVAGGQRRPHFLGRLDALARLRQHQRVEPAELLGRVVDRMLIGQTPRHAHHAQG